MAGRLGAVADSRGRCPIPDDTAGDALLHQPDGSFRRAFEVERLRQTVWIERVVRDRDLLVEDLLAESVREVAALFEQAECTERIV